ncbi:MAG: hypothetical protein QW184_00890 [Nanopusillaceae archaeon]
MIYSNNTASAFIQEQVEILSSSFEIKNINALLASKVQYGPIYLPIYDFLISSSFNDDYIKNVSLDILNKTVIDYSRKNLYFGYCSNSICYNCDNMIPLPTRYGKVVVCSIRFSSFIIIGDKC